MRVSLIACLFTFVWAPVMAAPTDDLENEIIYRTNLGRADDIKLLVKQGASPNQTNDEGVPLLALAASRKDKEAPNVVKALLESDANVNAKDQQGKTALFYAAKYGNKEIVLYLMDQKIDYYATDNSGNIARTVAFQAGHKDIVEAMDGWVNSQTEAVQKQYKELHDKIENQYKIGEEQQSEIDEGTIKAAEERNKEIEKQYEERNKKIAEEQKKKLEEKLQKKQALEAKRNSEAFKKATYDLAFNNCAFQYWSYCFTVKQSTELSEDELDIAIASHKDHIVTLSEQLINDYQLKRKAISTAAQKAKQLIFKQLEKMPSKSYRKEHGIGKMADMKERCDDIAKHLDMLSVASAFEDTEAVPVTQKNQRQAISKNSAAKNTSSKNTNKSSGKQGKQKH